MENKSFLSSVLKSAFFALIISLSGILIFAIIVKFTAPTDTLIKIVNQFIKVLAVASGCFFFTRGNLGIVKGAIAGALCTFLTYAIFALMSGSQLFSAEMFIDLLLTAVVGGITGIIAVNIKGKE